MGHLGRERLIELCRQRCYWPGYEKDITHYIRKKCKCVKDKKPNKQQTGPRQSITILEPFELVTIDYLHLDRSKGGYEYLLVVVDHSGKFEQAFPTKNKSGRAVADLLFNKYFLDFGFPKRILHDQGKEFDNKLFQWLSEITDVEPSPTPPYHPMRNGLCERMNRKIINMIKTMPRTFKSNWKNLIKKLTFAYNNKEHWSTNCSPYFLSPGRNGCLPVDLMFDINTNNAIKNKSCSDYIQNWQNAMKEVYSKILQNNEIFQKNSKSNKRILGSTLTPGERVLLKNLSEGQEKLKVTGKMTSMK